MHKYTVTKQYLITRAVTVDALINALMR